MITRVHKKFLKDMAVLPEPYRKRIEELVFEKFPAHNSIIEAGAEKLTGHKGYYKIRVGDYRVGFELVNGVATFQRVLHRKEIYRKFPG